MSKKVYVIAALTVASCITFSCKKDKEVVPANPSPTQEQLPTGFSKLSVEQNKGNLEATGTQFIKDINDIHQLPAVDASANLIRLLQRVEMESHEDSPMGVVKALSNIHNGHGSETTVLRAMRLHGTVPSHEPESFQDFFDHYAGTYTWKSATEEWDFVSEGKNLTFKFPSTETGTSNDATLIIKDYQGKMVSIDDYNGDLPANLVMEMTVGSNKVMTYNFKAAYNSAGDPTSMNSSMAMGAYSFAITMGNDTKNATAEYSLKKNNSVLVAFGASSKGDFAIKNLESDEEDPSKIVNEGSAYLQVKNIRIAGKTDLKALYAAGFTGFSDYEASEETVKKDVELLNKHYKLMVYYTDSQEKIADTEFYTYKDTRWEYDWYYDENTGEWVDTTHEKEVLVADIRMVFADGSKSDFATYFNKGFEDFNKELEAFLKKF